MVPIWSTASNFEQIDEKGTEKVVNHDKLQLYNWESDPKLIKLIIKKL